MDAWPRMIFDALTQHIPDSAAWVPSAGMGVLAVLGLILLGKGARLAPLIAGCVFLVLGGVTGSFVAQWFTTPIWLTIIGAALGGFAVGLLFFKIWLALLVAGAFAAASLVLYMVRVVNPFLATYASRNLDTSENLVSLPEPGGAVAASQSHPVELLGLWTYLNDTVPGFHTSFWALVVSTGIAGLVFGLLMPRTARAFLAATAGTASVLAATVAALNAYWPAALAQLQSLGPWSWTIVGAVWLVSLVVNLRDVRERAGGRSAEAPAPEAEPAAA